MSTMATRKIVDFPKPSMAPPVERLESWKEIAAYLKKGARTVQRWESEEGLPVHRLRHDQGSTVYAIPAELDAWFASRQASPAPPAAAPAIAEASLAVLPFADMSQEKDQEYFCEGVAEEILHALSHVKGIKAASRTSSFQFRAAGVDVREIGRRLGVSSVMEGSVRKAGNRMRIAVHLTDAATGYQLWAESYELELRDIFSVQDQIAHSVVEALEVTLTPEEAGALARTPTQNVHAYDYYLRGRKFYFYYCRRDIEFARRLFAHAVELDPGFALAHAGLADCWSYLYLYAEKTEHALRQSDEASLRAVELDPQSAQAQASRAVSLSLSRRDEDAERAFERAIALDPKLFEALYFYARHTFSRGNPEKALRLYEQAIRVRPEDFQARLLMAQIYDDLGRPAEGRAVREQGIRVAQEHLDLNPDDARALYMAANGMAALGRREESRKYAERAVALQPDEPMLLYNVGCIFSLLGQTEEALDCLERAVRNGLTQRGWYEHDSNLDPLRPLPRFQALLAQL